MVSTLSPSGEVVAVAVAGEEEEEVEEALAALEGGMEAAVVAAALEARIQTLQTFRRCKPHSTRIPNACMHRVAPLGLHARR
jgi:hypothetical protein